MFFTSHQTETHTSLIHVVIVKRQDKTEVRRADHEINKIYIGIFLILLFIILLSSESVTAVHIQCFQSFVDIDYHSINTVSLARCLEHIGNR